VSARGAISVFRIALVIVAAAFAVAVASAQSDPIAARQALMKNNGREDKVGSDMVRGRIPFDLAKARAMFAAFLNAASKMPNLFPENSKTGGDTSASPEIWSHIDDVKARFAKLAAESKAAQESVTDLESFKVAYRNVNQICDGCHERYRVKKG
jgi:cytochrome c556